VADILPFRRPAPRDRHRGNTLCRHGHHRWRVDSAQRFDVKQGRLVTLYRCERCDKTRLETL